MFKIFKIGELGEQTIRTISEIKDKIDFFPVYQRYGNIWDISKKKLLIDTVLNGFDTPKFYFNYFIESNNPLNRNNKIYAVIDGKQRLQTILDFLSDKFALDKEFKYTDNLNINISGLTYSEIAEIYPEVISKIYTYTLDIVFVSTDQEDMLEELFLRLNGGSALTNAEKRNAIGGYFNQEVRKIVECHPFFVDNIRFKNPRYQHQDLLTKIAYIEANDMLISFKTRELNEFVRDNKTQTENANRLFETVTRNLDVLNQIFESKDFLLRGKGIIPVYYFFITRTPTPPTYANLREFLLQFENLRLENKKLEEGIANPTLIEFDRLNQQGVHTEKSLRRRYEILDKYFHFFQSTGRLEYNQVVLPEMDEEEEEEE